MLCSSNRTPFLKRVRRDSLKFAARYYFALATASAVKFTPNGYSGSCGKFIPPLARRQPVAEMMIEQAILNFNLVATYERKISWRRIPTLNRMDKSKYLRQQDTYSKFQPPQNVKLNRARRQSRRKTRATTYLSPHHLDLAANLIAKF